MKTKYPELVAILAKEPDTLADREYLILVAAIKNRIGTSDAIDKLPRLDLMRIVTHIYRL